MTSFPSASFRAIGRPLTDGIFFICLAAMAAYYLRFPFWFSPARSVGVALLLPHAFLPGFAGMCGAYFVSCLCLSRSALRGDLPHLYPRAIGAALAAIVVGSAVTAPVWSDDFYYYLAYGKKLGVLGLDLYASPLKDQSFDPLIGKLAPWWMDVTFHYGPVTAFLFGSLGRVSPASLGGSLLLWKGVWVLAYAATLGVANELFRDRSAGERLFLLWTLFANPFMLWHGLTDAHIDLWLLLEMLSFAALYGKRRDGLAGVLLALAASTKLTLIAAVPVFFLSCHLERRPRGVVTFLFSYFLLYSLAKGGEWTAILKATQYYLEARGPAGPLPALLMQELTVLRVNRSTATRIAGVFAALMFACFMRGMWRRGKGVAPIPLLLFSMGTLLSSIQFLFSWYYLECFPLAFFHVRRHSALLLLSGLSLPFFYFKMFAEPLGLSRYFGDFFLAQTLLAFSTLWLGGKIATQPKNLAYALILWLACLVILTEGFFYWDWNQGHFRFVLTLLMGGLVVSWERLERGPRLVFELPQLPRFAGQALVILVIAANLIAVFPVIESVTKTRVLEFDQGRMAYQALQLVARGINPYGAEVVLDAVAGTELINGLARNPKCLGDRSVTVTELRREISDLSKADNITRTPNFAALVKPTPECRELSRRSKALGYHYGPALLAFYSPFVEVWGPAGIYVGHLFGLVALLTVFAFVAWRGILGPRKWLTFGIFVLIVCLPPVLRHNFLYCSASDLIPVVCAFGFLFLILEDRQGWGALCLAMSLGMKLLPGILFVPLCVKKPKALALLVLSLGCLYGPPALHDPDGFFRNTSFPFLVNHVDGTSIYFFLPFLPAAFLRIIGLMLAAVLGYRLLASRFEKSSALFFIVAIHLVVYATTGVLHNNYLFWILPVLGAYVASVVNGTTATPAST